MPLYIHKGGSVYTCRGACIYIKEPLNIHKGVSICTEKCITAIKGGIPCTAFTKKDAEKYFKKEERFLKK